MEYKRGKNPKSRNGFKKGHKGFIPKERYKEISIKIAKSNTGKFRTEESKERMRKSSNKRWAKPEEREKVSGKKSNFWKGGRTLLYRVIKNTFEYSQWRSDIFTRDSFTCQECGVMGVALQAHHIKGLAAILEENKITTVEEGLECVELWNINNGIALCKKCHKKTNNYGSKAIIR